jgi:hypothetical protein
MSKKSKNKKTFSFEDYIKANRRGSREAELEDSTGWNSVHKAHATPKDYKRKGKHNKPLLDEEDED